MAVQCLLPIGVRCSRSTFSFLLFQAFIFLSLISILQGPQHQICPADAARREASETAPNEGASKGNSASAQRVEAATGPEDLAVDPQQPSPARSEADGAAADWLRGEELVGERSTDAGLRTSGPGEGSISPDSTPYYTSQEHLRTKLKEKWFIGAPTARNQTENEDDSGKEALSLSLLPAGLAADSAAPIKRPFDLVRRAAALFGDSTWLVTTDWHVSDKSDTLPALTYKQGHALAASVGSALDAILPNSELSQLDGANESLRLLGTWAANSVELLLADFGATAFGLTVVPMHPDMNQRRFLEVMIHTQITHLCSDWLHLEMVLDLVEKGQLANLSTIIALDAVGEQASLRAQSLQLTLVDFWDLVDPPKGSAWQRHRVAEQKGFDSSDIHAILYPRALSVPFNGVMLSNENVLASLRTLTDWADGAVTVTDEDRFLCVDSLASVHQRVFHLVVLQAGATAAFANRGLLTLQEDIRAVQPTVISATGGILPMLHAAARRTLKRMGRLRRFMLRLKLRWRARSYWRTGDTDLLTRPACCSPQTGVAFSTRPQNSNPDSPGSFRRIRAAPLGWASPVVTVALEKLSASDKAGLVEFHADGVPGRGGGSSPLVLDASRAESGRLQLTADANELALRHTNLASRRRHAVTEGEIVIKGACVSVGYYRHQTAFQRQLTAQGSYKTALVAISAGEDFPLLMSSAFPRNILTAEGEFIDLDEAERQIKKVPIVRRVFLYADDFHYSDDYGSSYENLVSLPALRDFVLQQIEGHTWLTLDTFERPKAIYLVPHDVTLPLGVFDSELDQKQSGFSILRRQLAEAYAKPIREMYAALSEQLS